MNIFLNFFKKKTTNESSIIARPDELNSSLINVLEIAEKYYRNEQLDKSLEYLYMISEKDISNFSKANTIKFYSIRGGCLQEFGYDFDAINDFDKLIALSPNDSNNYFMRSASKNTILDYEGEIDDLEKAIHLSTNDSPLNRNYNTGARTMGYESVLRFYQQALFCAKIDLQAKLEDIQEIENASNIERKEFLQKQNDDKIARRLDKIKRR